MASITDVVLNTQGSLMVDQTSVAPSVGLLSLLVMLVGPVAGPYVYVLFGAVLGAFTALSARKTSSAALRDAMFLLRVACTALLFTAPTTMLVVKYVQLPLEFVTGIAAYLIGWKWDTLSAMAWSMTRAKAVAAVNKESCDA